MTQPDDAYPGDLWYVVPDGGDEQPYHTPFKAHMELDKLGVAGVIEHLSAATGRREQTAARDAAGAWSTPTFP